MPDSSHQRRRLSFATLQDVRDDATFMVSQPHSTVGQWTFGQILDHLGTAMNASIDGYSFRGNWFLRTFVAPLIKNSVLINPMKPGFQLPKSAANYLPSPDITTEQGLSTLCDAIDRLGNEEPNAKHPIFGLMAPEEWMALHLRHSELHLSFVVPLPAEESTHPDE